MPKRPHDPIIDGIDDIDIIEPLCKKRKRNKSWKYRRVEFIQKCQELKIDAELIDTEDQWIAGTEKDSARYKPTMKCVRINCSCNNEIITSTSINNIISHGKLGCSGRKRNKSWKHRRAEFIEKCQDPKIDAKLLDTEDQWIVGIEKDGSHYKPTMKCVRIDCSCNNEIVTSSSINNIISKGRLGCSGRTPVSWKHRRAEFIEKCQDPKIDAELVDTEDQWISGIEKDKQYYKPTMKCVRITCSCNNEIVTSSSISSIISKGTLGCSGRTNVSWKHRRDKFIQKCQELKIYAELVDTEDQWIAGIEKDGYNYKPTMKCVRINCSCNNEIVTGSSIDGIIQGKLGCRGRKRNNSWKHRRAEFIQKCQDPKIDAELIDTEDQWIAGIEKDGYNYKPTMKCVRINCSCNNEIVTSSCVNSIISKGVLGCSGRTMGIIEGLVRLNIVEWLKQEHNEWTVKELRTKLHYNGKHRRVQIDYALYYRNVLKAIMEKDGPHHFSPFSYYRTKTVTTKMINKFLHKAERDCQLNIEFNVRQKLSLCRFHYDKFDTCVSFMRQFIQDVITNHNLNLGPIVRVSDKTLYNSIPVTVDYYRQQYSKVNELKV